jgi:FdhD protein
VSVPTSLAIQQAEAAGITLIGIARADGFEVFTRPDRVGPDRVGADREGLAGVATHVA